MAKSRTPALKGTGLRNAGIIMFIVGTLAAVASTYATGMAAHSVLQGFEHLPKERAIPLTAGQGVLEAHAGEMIVIARMHNTGAPATCKVTGPDGRVLPLEQGGRGLSDPTVELVGAVLAPTEGDYKIACDTEDDLAAVPVQTGTVLSAGALMGLALVGVFFGFVALLGIILFIVGLNKRGRAKRLARQTGGSAGYGSGPQYPSPGPQGYRPEPQYPHPGPQGYGPAAQGYGPSPQAPAPYGPMQGAQPSDPVPQGPDAPWQQGPAYYGRSAHPSPTPGDLGSQQFDAPRAEGDGRPQGS